MTQEEEILLERFQRWFDKNPAKSLKAIQCVYIAKQYHEKLIKKKVGEIEKIIPPPGFTYDFTPTENVGYRIGLKKAIEILKQ